MRTSTGIIRRSFLWLTLLLIVLLILLSIAGAFQGAQWSKGFFNSPPLSMFWLALLTALTGGLLVFASLRNRPALLLIHAGCILVLLGAMWGSDAGHRLANLLLQRQKVPKGYMLIQENQAENRILSGDGNTELARLPFEIYLHDFSLDHYENFGKLLIQSPQGGTYQMPAKAGEFLSIDPSLPKITILRVFKNFRLQSDPDGRQAVDSPETGSNPTLQIELAYPDGAKQTLYVFQKFPHFSDNLAHLDFLYSLPVRDYFSDLAVRRGEQILARKTIEVNHPLHFGGYYFYQHSYDDSQGRYTVLSVASDSGRSMVLAGYGFLVFGLFYHFWIEPVLRRTKTAMMQPDQS